MSTPTRQIWAECLVHCAYAALAALVAAALIVLSDNWHSGVDVIVCPPTAASPKEDPTHADQCRPRSADRR